MQQKHIYLSPIIWSKLLSGKKRVAVKQQTYTIAWNMPIPNTLGIGCFLPGIPLGWWISVWAFTVIAAADVAPIYI